MLRFAPTSTKDLDVSSLRVAIFNYILSKQLKQNLVIRIEDIDKQKNIEGKDKEIVELLNLFSIEHSSVLLQSESLKYHQKLAMQLVNQKKAFACFCGDDKLKELKQKAEKENKTFEYDGFCAKLSDDTVLNTNAPFCIRVKKPNSSIEFTDLLKGKQVYSPSNIDSFIILNRDKTARYNYACAIDDMLMNISTIIREEKHLLNSAKQIHIRKLLGYNEEIKYIHIPTIKNSDKFLVKNLISDGYLPSAIANYLVLLGNKTPKEIFSLEDAIKWFKIEDISKNEEYFDIEKLNDLNKKHLFEIDNLRLSQILGFADEDIGKLGKIFIENCNTINEIKIKIQQIFSQKSSYEKSKNEFTKIKESLKKAPFIDDFEKLKDYIIKDTGISNEKAIKPLSYLITADDDSSKLSQIYPLIKNYLGEIIK